MRSLEPALNLRRAAYSDTCLLYQWANNPVVRSQAFSSQPISWFDHIHWCHSRIARCNTIWIAEKQSCAVGQVRFDLRDNRLWVDIHLDENCRGKGLGLHLLERAIALQSAITPGYCFCAQVKIVNSASCRLFVKAGFVLVGLHQVQGQWCWQFERFNL